jgi:hypothetical protein
MQIVQNTIFDSTVAATGAWRNISNFVALSVQLTGLEGDVYVEVSNDPNILTDGPAIAAPAAPTISTFVYSPSQFPLSNPGTYTAVVTLTTRTGETTESAASAPLVVPAGKTLLVASPAADTGGYAVGYNVYLSLNGGAYLLQNPATSNPVGPGNLNSLGPIPLGRPFILYAFQSSNVQPPLSNTADGPAAGINISGTFTGAAWSAPTGGSFGESQVVIDTTNKLAMFNPSCLVWNFIRVVKTGGSALETKAFLFGQNG